MQLTGLEEVMIAGAIATAGIAIGAVANWMLAGNRCNKCGIDSLRRDIRVQFYMIRHLAQKQGTTPDELLQIESQANTAMSDHRQGG